MDAEDTEALSGFAEESYHYKQETKGLWQMKDGQRIEIEKMEDSHLLYSMKLLERNQNTNICKYKELYNEIQRRISLYGTKWIN